MKNKKSKLAVTLASSALLAGGIVSCSEKSPQSKAPASGASVIPAARLAGLSKAEIKKLLVEIEAAKPTEPHLFAGCYDVMLPPQATEYVCPVCSEKTLYTKEQFWAFQEDLDSCRRFLSYITRQ